MAVTDIGKGYSQWTPDVGMPDFNAWFSSWMQGTGQMEALGLTQVENYGGAKPLSEYLTSEGLSEEQIKQLKNFNIDPSKRYNLEGLADRARMDRAIAIIKRDTSGGTSDKFQQTLQDFSAEVNRAGEVSPEISFEQTGINQLQAFDKLRAWQKANPGKQLPTKDMAQIAEITGIDQQELTDANVQELRDLAESEDFSTYQQYQDIGQQQLENLKLQQERFAAAQEKINTPGYAKEAAESAFAPAEAAVEQYYGKGGEFDTAMGESEAAAGRVGDARVAAYGAKLKAEKKTQVKTQKGAYAGQIQQAIDMSNPMEALRLSAQMAPQAQSYMQAPANAALEPVAKAFPYSFQQYQQSLMPYQYGQVLQGGPSGLDYALQGVSAVGQLGQAAAQTFAGKPVG